MFKLYYASTSPYVRKVMITAHCLGLSGQIEKLESAAHPVQRDSGSEDDSCGARVVGHDVG